MPERRQLPHDWYAGGIPANVQVEEHVYLDSSYAFAAFHSRREPGLTLGYACGVYDRAAFVVGPEGRVCVGSFTCLNGTYIVCEHHISIGAHCLLSWGVVVTDSDGGLYATVDQRRVMLRAAAQRADRWLTSPTPPLAVTIEDNVWIGFDAVVLPSVTIGQGCIIGCKSIVCEDIPPYSIAVGNPARVVRTLQADDPAEVRQRLLEEYGKHYRNQQ